jgi:hypothetical protein
MSIPLTRAIRSVEFRSATWPFFVYFFGTYALLADIKTLHIQLLIIYTQC